MTCSWFPDWSGSGACYDLLASFHISHEAVTLVTCSRCFWSSCCYGDWKNTSLWPMVPMASTESVPGIENPVERYQYLKKRHQCSSSSYYNWSKDIKQLLQVMILQVVSLIHSQIVGILAKSLTPRAPKSFFKKQFSPFHFSLWGLIGRQGLQLPKQQRWSCPLWYPCPCSFCLKFDSCQSLDWNKATQGALG